MEKYIGEKFGILTVVRNLGYERQKQATMVECLCECGNLTIVRYSNLSRLGPSRTQSCGCLKKFGHGDASFNQLFSSYKRRAKRAGLEFSLTEEDFEILTSSNCYYCGIPPAQETKRNELNGNYVYNGIDRADNSKGYILENCVSCCKPCNSKKGYITFDIISKIIEIPIWKKWRDGVLTIL